MVIPLTGFRVTTWPPQFSASQLIGLRIVTDRFVHRGILPGDFAVVVKKQFAKFRDGDLIVILTGDSGVEIEEYSSQAPPKPKSLLGRIIRSWREY